MFSVTQLGNSSLLLLIVIVSSLFFAVQQYKRAAIAIWLSFVISAAVITFSKLLFLGCVDGTPYGLRSPSGHAALSFATYGILGILFATAIHGFLRSLFMLGVLTLITLIAISRVSLGYHSAMEVLYGVVVGLMGVGVAQKYYFTYRTELLRFNAFALLLLIGLIAWGLGERNIPAESIIKRIARQLPEIVPVCEPAQASHSGNLSRANSSSYV